MADLICNHLPVFDFAQRFQDSRSRSGMENGINGATTTTKGHKRHADDALETEQRLTKRFHLLNLGAKRPFNASYYSNSSTDQIGRLYTPTISPPRERRQRSNAFSDSMHLDDSKDRVYIHNLDDEVSDIESEEEKLVFLPDIEKRLAKIPNSVLMGRSQPHTNNEVVLYSVPESLSVPPEQDNVRKAIIETRARAREKQTREAMMPRTTQQTSAHTTSSNRHIAQPFQSLSAATVDMNAEDAMDIDL